MVDSKQDLFLDLISKMRELDIIYTILKNNYYNKISASIDKSIDRIDSLKDELWDLKNSNKLYLNCDNSIMSSIIEDLKFINNKLEITNENLLKTDINTGKSALSNIISKIKKPKINKKTSNNSTELSSESYNIAKPIVNFSEYFKFISLNLEKFKNFDKFQHNFISHNNLSILIGNNGSGKSNLLEAISAIFTELFLSVPTTFGYKLEYDINGSRVILQKELGKRKQYICNNKKVTKQRLEVNGLIPSKVIAMYSGEEIRLWNNYYRKAYNKWKKDVSKVNRLRYISKDYWDIALFALLMSESEDHKSFIEHELSINNTDYIEFEFDLNRLKNSIYSNLDYFVDTINPKGKYKVTYKLDQLKKLLSYLDGYSIFTLLTNASMHNSNKMIKSVKVYFNNGLCIYDLSEGEKKKLLLKATMDFVADENSIVLLDEPDAHIHEVGKADICTMFEKYSEEFNRQIIVTTHSPTLAHCASNNHLIMLENKNGISSTIDTKKINIIKELSGGIWSETQQNIFLTTNNAIVVTEGILDLKYINYAKSIFKKDYKGQFDCLTCNGADNMLNYVKTLLGLDIPDKKIIVVLDRDNEGKKSLAKFLNKKAEDIKISDKNVYYKNNVYIFMLPKTTGFTGDNFVIEDYFPAHIKKQCIETAYNNINYDFSSIPTNFQKTVKSKLEDYIKCKDENCMEGFKILLNKIEAILKGNERDCKELNHTLDSI